VEEGETLTEEPVPTKVPPQDPEYQFQEAPVPKEPPFTESEVDCPGHIGFALTEALEGSVELEFTVTVTVAQEVLLHVPSART
jgi:hypothetical protein